MEDKVDRLVISLAGLGLDELLGVAKDLGRKRRRRKKWWAKRLSAGADERKGECSIQKYRAN